MQIWLATDEWSMRICGLEMFPGVVYEDLWIRDVSLSGL